MRLNRYLAACGVCSRREADRLIEGGRVTVDGQPAAVGMAVGQGAVVEVDGQRVTPRQETIVFAYHKVPGVVCTERDAHASRTLADELAGRPEVKDAGRLLYIGRLDKESEGLLLLTTDAELKRRLESARGGVEKEYEVTVDQPLTKDAAKRLEKGVFLRELGLKTRPCRIRLSDTDPRHFTVILTEGKNRQIRRMCESEGLRVTRLVRVREGNIRLGDLKPGGIRRVSQEEMEGGNDEADGR